MKLDKYYRDLWLEKNSKGLWWTKDNEGVYVEDLTDSHLCRIPHYLYKSYLENKTYKNEVPRAIVLELASRGYIINKLNNFKVYDKKQRFKVKPIIKNNKPIIPNKNNILKEIQKKRNTILLRRNK